MKDSPTLSLVIPTHGRVDLFETTLQSVYSQTLDTFELVISDDSAQEEDRTRIKELVDVYREQTERKANYIHTAPRLGQAKNTNQGMCAATGDIVRLLHSDDLLRPGALAWELAHFQERADLNVLFQDALAFEQDTEIEWVNEPIYRLIEPGDYFRQNLSTCTALPSGLLFRRTSLEDIGGMRDDWSFLCDWEFFAKLIMREMGARRLVGYAQAGNCAWRIHEDSTTGRRWRDHFTEHRALMQEWKQSLADLEEDLFVSAKDRKAFFRRGESYREHRLINDVKKLKPELRADARSWVRNELGAKRYYSMLWRLRAASVKKRLKKLRRRVKHTIRSPKNKPAPVAVPHSKAKASAADVTLQADLAEGEMSADALNLVVPFDNGLSLWQVRLDLLSARRIKVVGINRNRFWSLVLQELLKYIAPGAEVEFVFVDNEHMTWFGLKAMVNTIAEGRFEMANQNVTPTEAMAEPQGLRRVVLRCVAPPEKWHSDPMSGLTVGVLTLGDRMEELNALIDSAMTFATMPIEILIVAPEPIAALEGRPNIRQLVFEKDNRSGKISEKKNLICQLAAYSDIAVCHDRFTFTPSFFESFQTWGTSYAIATPKVRTMDGRRGLDWGVVQGENYSWSTGGLLEYRDHSKFSYAPGGVTMIRKSAWEAFPWSPLLYWNEHEDVELSRRLQRAGQRVSLFPGIVTASRDRWVDQNPRIPFCDHKDL